MVEQAEAIEEYMDDDLIVGTWKQVSDDGVEERVANVDLKRDRRLKKPVHFVCPLYQNHAFNLGAVNHRDKYGRLLNAGRRGRTCRFFNGNFMATTQAELDYCRSKSYIFEEPDEGYVHTFPEKGISTRNPAAFQAYLTKIAS